MATCTTANPIGIQRDRIFTCLDLGHEFQYLIPSFAVISVSLRKSTIKVSSDDGQVHLYDAFIKSVPSLTTMVPPFSLELKEFCFIPVSIQLL